MADLSDAVNILKRAQQQQSASRKDPKAKTVVLTTTMPVSKTDKPVYNLTSPSGKVVKMMGDDELKADEAVVAE